MEKTSIVRKIFKRREFFIVMADIVIFIGMGFIKPIFLSPANLSALALTISMTLIVSVGLTLIIIMAQIDLSTASMLCLSGAVAGMADLAGVPSWLCIIIAISVGTAGGLINGYLVSYFGLAPFVATLATTYMYRGFLTGIRQGVSLFGFSEKFQQIGQGYLFGVQYPIIVGILVFVLGVWLTSNMKFFRQAWYIGGNQKAALLSGIPVKKQMMLYFTITGALCGLAGILTASRFGAITSSTSKGQELIYITAVVVGGVSMAGGSGTVFGSLFGALLMASINNIFNLLGLNNFWQDFITGATLFVAVSIDQLTLMNKQRQDIRHAEEMLRKFDKEFLAKEKALAK